MFNWPKDKPIPPDPYTGEGEKEVILSQICHSYSGYGCNEFRWLIHFTVQRSLHMRFMDVVTAYLYGDLDKDIYMKITQELCNSMQLGKIRNPSIKLCKSLWT